MIRFTVVVREAGSLKPDYSLKFEAPTLPREGEYISIQRIEERPPFGEDMIVRKVWWRLGHAITAGVVSLKEADRAGHVDEIFVECEPAIGPWSTDNWRDMLTARGAPQLEVSRLSVRQSDLRGGED